MKNIYLNGFYENLLFKRRQHAVTVPVRSEAIKFIEDLLEFLFPHFSKQRYFDVSELESKAILLRRNLKYLLKSLGEIDPNIIDDVSTRFFEALPDINENLWKDAHAIYEGDPASTSVDEVILAYPGFLAISIYRFAHVLYQLEVSLLPRIISEYAHQVTGIDINPGANIGESFFIDHGTGIVIGETTQIGDNVKIYQGVTIGALSVDKKLESTKRHPTIEDNVVIYSNAVILGGATIIGQNSTIGGNTWITKSIPANSVVYNKNEIVLKNETKENEFLDFVI